MRTKIAIVGAGNWGTTLGVVLSRKSNLQVALWSFFREHAQRLIRERENKDFLPSVKLPAQLRIILDLKDVFDSSIIIIAVPVEYMRGVLREFKKYSYQKKIFVSVSKGIEIKSLKRPSEIIREELGDVSVAVLSGPTIAKEVVKGIPSTAVICTEQESQARRLQDIFMLDIFRVYRHNDIVGVELAGALKNVIAIACGISDGLGFGTNTKAALVCRGLREMIRFAEYFGAQENTLFGISGLGDLATTCFSVFSRNHFVGEQIGKGKKSSKVLGAMRMVAEGVPTAKAVYLLSRKMKIDMPITAEVYHVLYKNRSPYQAVRNLMQRKKKAE